MNFINKIPFFLIDGFPYSQCDNDVSTESRILLLKLIGLQTI